MAESRGEIRPVTEDEPLGLRKFLATYLGRNPALS